MKKIYSLIFILVLFLSADAQTFHRFYSQAISNGDLYRCIQTADGGYASAGKVTDVSVFDADFLLIKANANGTLLWSKKIPFSGSDNFNDIIETTGGGLVVIGTSSNISTATSEAVAFKYDASGSPLWSNSYTAAGSSTGAKCLQQHALGNLYVLGSISTSPAPDDYFIMKLDASGNLLRQTYFVTPEADLPLAFVRNPTNGDFYLSGAHDLTNGENIHLLKVDSNMAVLWNVLMGGTIRYFCYDMKMKASGNVVLGGRYDDTVIPNSIFLAEINPSGNQVWANSYSALDSLRPYALGITLNGNNTGVTGAVQDTSRGTLAMEVNNIGNVNWSERIGAASGEYATGYGINVTADSGYIVCGNRGDLIGSNSIVQLIKLTGAGAAECHYANYPLIASSVTLPSQNLIVTAVPGTMIAQNISVTAASISGTGDACAVGIDEADAENIFSVYPNPAGEELTILNRTNRKGIVNIFNALGENIISREIVSGEKEIKLNVKNISAGIYFIRVNAGLKNYSRKLIIE